MFVFLFSVLNACGLNNETGGGQPEENATAYCMYTGGFQCAHFSGTGWELASFKCPGQFVDSCPVSGLEYPRLTEQFDITA